MSSAGDLDGDGLDDPFPDRFALNGAACNEPFKPLDIEVYDPVLQADTIAKSRTAVDGAFKVSTLRMTELTGPYFHNGGQASLDEVVAFYNRGGDFPDQNAADLAPEIRPLGLTGGQQAALVAFLKSLTDDRVRCEAAPFDRPQFFVPKGHLGDENEVVDDGRGAATDDFLELPAISARGRLAEAGLRDLLTFEEKLAAELFGYFDLRTATVEAKLLSNRPGKTRNSLLHSLDSILAKVTQGAIKKAIAELDDFQDSVTSMLGSKRTEPEIDEDDAIGILALVADAIAALGAL